MAGAVFNLTYSFPEIVFDEVAIKKAIKAGRAILEPEVKKNLEESIKQTPKHYGKRTGKLLRRSERTGGLVASQRTSRLSKPKNSESFSQKIYFSGKDAHGVRYGAIAAIKEYGVNKGNRTQEPSPFVKTTLRRKKTDAIKAMREILEQELIKIE